MISQVRRSAVLQFSDTETALAGKQNHFLPYRTAILIVECDTVIVINFLHDNLASRIFSTVRVKQQTAQVAG